jgi:hypothetical protein
MGLRQNVKLITTTGSANRLPMMDIDNMDIGLDNNVVGFEDGGKRRPNTASAIGNKMFQRGLDGFILKFASSLISKVSRISMECQNE